MCEGKASIYWLSDEEYAKAVGTLRLQLGAALTPFNTYGLGVFISGAIEEATRLAEDFALRVRGVDKIISIERIRKSDGRGGYSGRG